jgi:hypothetical protein
VRDRLSGPLTFSTVAMINELCNYYMYNTFMISACNYAQKRGQVSRRKSNSWP